jgi:hypothetical protein|tara:strand:- start:122 stop:535 length:414 start_codon:yes stop_codon:yes gene_type:complete
MTPAQRLLDRLEKVRQTGDGRWMARCPAHDDRTPSLSIKECDDGRLLMHCFAGCPAGDVLTPVGLSLGDLFPEGMRSHHKRGLPQWKMERLRAHADHETIVLACMRDDFDKGVPIDVERAAKAKERLSRIGGLLNDR